jgi:single-stranded-DNA-specific exonuclease
MKKKRMKVQRQAPIQKRNNRSQEYSAAFNIPEELASIIARRFPLFSEAESFLFPNTNQLHDPSLIPDMEAAVECITAACVHKEGVLVYCHDDPDGYTSGVLMYTALRDCAPDRNQIYIYPMQREKDGYILNPAVLQEYRKKDVGLVVTCDFGISSVENFRIAEAEEMKLVVCDHHEIYTEEFSAPAVDPKRPDSQYPFLDMAGVGVVFKLAQKLYQRVFKLTGEEFYRLKKEFFALTLIGTISDRVTLLDENRVLCKEGLSLINKLDAPWVQEFKKDGDIDVSKLISVIIPTLGSASYHDPQYAIRLLTSDDQDEVRDIVQTLQEVTVQRRQGIAELFKEACLAAKIYPDVVISVIPFSRQHYLGSVAARMKDTYGKTIILVGLKHDRCHGELRSPDIDLSLMLNKLSRYFSDFGGHRKAAGFTMSPHNLEEFITAVIDYTKEGARSTHTTDKTDAEPEAYVPRDRVRILKPMLPFGEGNPPPLLTDSTSVYTIDNAFRIIEREDSRWQT